MKLAHDFMQFQYKFEPQVVNILSEKYSTGTCSKEIVLLHVFKLKLNIDIAHTKSTVCYFMAMFGKYVHIT